MPASCALSLPFSFAEVLILPLDSVLGIQPCPQSYNSWDYSKLDPERFRREKLCRRKTLINSKASLMASAPSALATPSHHLVEVRKGLGVEILRPAPVSCVPSARSYYFQRRAGIRDTERFVCPRFPSTVGEPGFCPDGLTILALLPGFGLCPVNHSPTLV